MILNYIGSYSLLFSLLISSIIFFISIFSIQNKKNSIRNLNKLFFFQFFLVLISFLSLIILFVISEFSNTTVFNNSHTNKPLLYKISGTWGNHEGSLILWLMILTFFVFIYFLKSNTRPIRERLFTIVFQQIIIIGFSIFLLKTSNPFNQIIPTPGQGLGLNPILQDPILAIHPPVLYLGYVSTSLIFSSALASLICLNVNREWAGFIKNWIFVSWIFLTLGILLGSIWAYYELGWGGFWFWDPVENISLMPWLCLTALLHCTLVLEKRSSLGSWTIILSIVSFTLSICGTFLVRSGILNSVHTFANDPDRGVYILIFLFFLIFISLIIYFLYQDKIISNKDHFNFLSKESSILINNWFVMYFLSVVLIGTIYPIFLEVLSNEKISVGPPFFNKLIIPFLIPFLIFMAIGPNLKWIKAKKFKISIRLSILLFINLIIAFLVLKIFDEVTLKLTLLLTASFYLFFITFKDLIKKEYKNISQTISHFGFSLLILSIILNSFLSKEIITNLKVGDEINFQENIIKFKKIESSFSSNYQSLIGHFEINNKHLFTPEVRIYDQPEVITSEADIKTNLFKDRFLVINLVKDNDYLNVRYQEKPLMIWIWLSTILITIGGSISFIKKYEK